MIEERLRKYILNDNTITQDVKDDIEEVLKELSKYKEQLERCRKQKRKVENACHNYNYKINKAIEFAYKKMYNEPPANSREYDYYCEKLLKILEEE